MFTGLVECLGRFDRADFSVDDIPAVMCAVGAVMAAESRMPMRADRFVELVIDGLRAP